MEKKLIALRDGFFVSLFCWPAIILLRMLYKNPFTSFCYQNPDLPLIYRHPKAWKTIGCPSYHLELVPV